jgi:NADH-quinone oxidoreductase subunit M
MVQQANWIPAFNIQYKVGIDGLSFPLVILSTFICVLSCVASWNIEKMTKGYMALFLFLETGILGVFSRSTFSSSTSSSKVSLLPMYFLIGIWGGPRKEYAAIKFFLYTLVGSIGLLIVLIGTYLYSRGMPGYQNGTFDLVRLASRRSAEALRRQHRRGELSRQDVLPAADARLPDQGAGGAVPHLAAGRARRGPDPDQHDPCRPSS